MSEKDQKTYEFTLTAEVALHLTTEAGSFEEAFAKATQFAQDPYSIEEEDMSDMTWFDARVTMVQQIDASHRILDEELIKDDYEVVMDSYGTQKIKVIKAVRAFTGLSVREAKSMVESAPTTIATVSSLADASTIKTALESAGASVFINNPRQDNVVDFRPSPQFHSNKDEG